MERTYSAALCLSLVVVNSLFLAQDAGTASCNTHAARTVSDAYVQITSVAIEPSKIHKSQGPKTTTVVVQVLLRGAAPPKPEAIVEVGSFSSDPPNNELKYENPTRTVPLEKGVTVVKFKAETTANSFQGKVKVAVTLGGASKGINIKDSEPKDFVAEATILAP